MARQVTVRRRSLHDIENPMRAYAHLTPAERIALVWDLTLQAIAFQGATNAEPRLSRHLVRIVRRVG